MDILNSDWLIYMLHKAGKTPQARMLALFDILDDWLDAPGVDAKIEQHDNKHALMHYLRMEATQAGAAQPEMLATQLCLMAISACNRKLEMRAETEQQTAYSNTLKHAKNAAQALITAQTRQEFRIAKSTAYGIAASVAALIIAGGFMVMHQSRTTQTPAIAASASSTPTVVALAPAMASPEDTVALIEQIDQMRKGRCQLPEALQLPDAYKKVYFENIVSGQISTDPSQQKLTRELLKMVRCDYTPMLMENSKQ